MTQKKIHFDQLVIEVTRKCNMHCAHCMRGDSQNIDLNEGKLAKFISQIGYIGSLTFTGGEPTLNIPAIRAALTYCKLYDIPVMDFYIVTNGKEITNEFLNTLIDWYVYCIECGGEPEMCGVALSQDKFHDSIKPDNVAKLRALSFYRPDDKKTRNWNAPSIIDLGRARAITDLTKRNVLRPDSVDVADYGDYLQVTDAAITFTVNGEILADCDYEYENTEEIKLCNFNNASDIFTKIATDPNYIIF